MARILELLERAHGERQWEYCGKAIDVLVGAILSQNTSDANSDAGYERLMGRFGSWDAVADAPVRDIERCIRVSGLSRVKAPRIKRILRQVRKAHGEVSLEHLAKWQPQDALDYLMRFDGVGPKTALCVLIFSFHVSVFPVDTHIFRVTRRLGVLPANVPAARAHEVLTPMIPPQDRYSMHVLLIAHGRSTCRSRKPLCRRCYLLGLCPCGQENLARREQE